MHDLHSIIYTVGHSTHSVERLIALLYQYGITALCDVRSMPYSRMNPQFNKEALKNALHKNGIAYVFLGKELGARSEDPSCYERGKVQYDRLAQSPPFQQGLTRVLDGMKKYRITLLCAEKDPLECHRTILVARQLKNFEVEIHHILADGQLESDEEALNRLMRQLKLPENDMFRTRGELIDEAYRAQGERIAYQEVERTSEDEFVQITSQ